MASRGAGSFDRVADVYDATRALPPAVASALREALLRALAETAPQARLLEVGIGTGRIALPLAAAGVRVVGIDLSARMLEVLRRKGGKVAVVRAEARRLPFRAAAFDAALFSHVLHLVADAEVAIAEGTRVVRPGGRLILVSEDHDEGPHLEARRLVWDVVEELTSARRTPDPHARAAVAFARVGAQRGATLEERTVVRYEAPFSPRRALAHLRRRDFSSTWSIPEAGFERVLAALEERYARRWGDLDREQPATKALRLTLAHLSRRPA
jgi:ubiquinone/menaquinone biosynthesis C-methylase UbiE